MAGVGLAEGVKWPYALVHKSKVRAYTGSARSIYNESTRRESHSFLAATRLAVREGRAVGLAARASSAARASAETLGTTLIERGGASSSTSVTPSRTTARRAMCSLKNPSGSVSECSTASLPWKSVGAHLQETPTSVMDRLGVTEAAIRLVGELAGADDRRGHHVPIASHGARRDR